MSSEALVVGFFGFLAGLTLGFVFKNRRPHDPSLQLLVKENFAAANRFSYPINKADILISCFRLLTLCLDVLYSLEPRLPAQYRLGVFGRSLQNKANVVIRDLARDEQLKFEPGGHFLGNLGWLQAELLALSQLIDELEQPFDVLEEALQESTAAARRNNI